MAWQNARPSGEEILRTDELYTVGEHEAGYVFPRGLALEEDPSSVVVTLVVGGTELTEVTGTPAAGEYRVLYADQPLQGAFEFNAAQEDAEVEITYKSRADLVWAHDLERMDEGKFGAIADDTGAVQFISATGAIRVGAGAGLGVAFDTANRGFSIGLTPAAPSGLTADGMGTGQIDLTWVDNSNNETGFEVWRSTDNFAGGNGTLVTTNAAGDTTYSDTGLVQGQLYYYRVFAKNAFGKSAASNTASATAGVIITDSFNRANSTTSLGSTDTGEAWVALAGTHGINSNRAYLVSSVGNDVAYVETGEANGIVKATLAVVSTNSLRLAARIGPAANQGFWLQCNNGSNFTLFRVNGGATSIGSYAATPANGDIVEIVLNGSAISVKINGTTRISVTDTFNQSSTKHGIGYAGVPGAERFDEWDFRTA